MLRSSGRAAGAAVPVARVKLLGAPQVGNSLKEPVACLERCLYILCDALPIKKWAAGSGF